MYRTTHRGDRTMTIGRPQIDCEGRQGGGRWSCYEWGPHVELIVHGPAEGWPILRVYEGRRERGQPHPEVREVVVDDPDDDEYQRAAQAVWSQ